MEDQREVVQQEKKKKGIGAWIYRIVILALLGVMGFSGYQLFNIYSGYHEGTVIYNDFADEFGAGKVSSNDNSRLKLDWEKLHEKYPDVKAWIRCRGTKINYPIVQGQNNSFYLTHAPTGEYTAKGALFIDYAIKNPFVDFNTIVYGHRMKDGTMFNPITNFFGEGGIEFYDEHPTMELYTAEHDYDVEIFACATVEETDMEAYRMDFSYDDGEEDLDLKQQYIDRVMAMNELQAYTGIEVSPHDRLIMMSTCTARGSSVDPHREVVWGRLVTPKTGN